MNNTYPELNEFLNSFCIYYDYPLYMDHISEYLSLSVLASRMLSIDISKGIIAGKIPKAELSLSLDESLDLCNQFIKKYLDSYYDKWQSYLCNGVVDFLDEEQNMIDGKDSQGSWSLTSKKDNQLFREINIELKHDYSDPAVIIHEFLHQLNISDTQDSNEIVSRSLFTEAVSIYFETLMYHFMEEQGYSKQEIAKVQFRRIQDYAKLVAQSIDGLMILRDYLFFGKISDTTFEESSKNNLLRFDTKQTYQKIASDFNNKIAAKKEKTNIGINCEFDIFKPFRYVIGTSLAYWAIEQEDSNMPWKMLTFNEDLANDRDLDYAFSRFPLNIGNLYSLISGVEKEMIRCSKNLNYNNEKKM